MCNGNSSSTRPANTTNNKPGAREAPIPMNTPNPLIPQGSFLEQQKSKSKSNLFIAVLAILAIHIVFFSGLLMQKRG
jgi:hypothetical protein